ncbi:DUF1236 domain-containing protein [Rhizobium sp. BK251]|uniref:DUF1236 domain-containing protein n=1 Tax=Rhizobium sp. BK251 TaxID=2512125 RepID=UPI00104CE183|nr:DUF1236 domain-containing protein [Rhizobium sp. BK251]TCL66423.1 uncharacterized protein DUF1236 [Rhizobium sp. BK251]
MKTKLLIVSAIALGSFATAASAQNGTVTGAAGGAVTGAIVGGPVGAAVGGVAGAIAGTVIDPPPQKVVTYVEQQPVSADAVVVQEPVVVGKPLPRNVVVTPVPDDDRYGYAVVNQQRVIVDPHSYKVVQIIR